MQHAKKMASVDPRLVNSVLARQQPIATTIIIMYYVLGRLDANMKSIIERTYRVYTRTGYCVRPLM